jgi:outer membrane receptor protein involved in Fe transport
LADLYDSANNASGETVLPDPVSSTGRSTVLAIQGNNPNLKPETAKTWTAGLDLVPTIDPGLKLSFTYYAIDYEGQIAVPANVNPFDILLQQNEWAAVITRNPTPAQIAAVCNRPDYFQPRAQCLASSPAAIIDGRLANLASTKVTGLDVDLRQTLKTGLGHFDFGFNGSYVFHFDQAVSSASPSVDIVNTYGNPLKLRFRAKIGWSQFGDDSDGLGANLAVNYTNGYDNPGSMRLSHIDSLTTVDMQLRYRTPPDNKLTGGLELSLNAVNVFNQSPPFADNLYGYDFANVQGLGRVLSLSVRKRW